jgi:protein tyrosine phosphatase
MMTGTFGGLSRVWKRGDCSVHCSRAKHHGGFFSLYWKYCSFPNKVKNNSNSDYKYYDSVTQIFRSIKKAKFKNLFQ